MKNLPTGMQSHLDSGATTLCWCWRVTRTDNTVMGFTDHDNDLTFENTTYKAATGFTGSEMNNALGLSVDNVDIDGALSSTSLTETDLTAGLYDNATVEIYRVNWQDVSQSVLMRKGSIGEVRRGKHIFTAEIRGLAHNLQQPKGRLLHYGCDANLGDSRCQVSLGSSSYKGTGTVLSFVDTRTFTVSGLESFTTDWFAFGLLAWTSGLNQNRAMEVKYHTKDDSLVTIELWRNMADAIAVGHTFEITAGCDKQISTCRTKFSNISNFRGFPHIPGNDFTLSYPNRDDVDNDGGSLVQ
ncbi:MAG: DUF2163 domain-containing protein [Pseudomonadota bacterium]